jgi:small subunit ribosomal protein S16
MAVKIRLARGGAKKRPFYKIVASDARSARDGDFIEKLGTFNPLLPKDGERVQLNAERVKYWLSVGATPTDVISRILVKLGLAQESKKTIALRNQSIKRVEAKKAAEAAAAEAAAKAAEAPAA